MATISLYALRRRIGNGLARIVGWVLHPPEGPQHESAILDPTLWPFSLPAGYRLDLQDNPPHALLVYLRNPEGRRCYLVASSHGRPAILEVGGVEILLNPI